MNSTLINSEFSTLDEMINEEIVMLKRVGLNCGAQRNGNCKH